MSLIDTHAHLDSFEQRGELAAVLARARAAGLEGLIAIGTGSDDWALYREMTRTGGGFIHFTVGLHPCSVNAGWEEPMAQLDTFWHRGQVPETLPVAIGECGLDRFHLPKDPDEAARIFAFQRAAFEAQLALARRVGCPIVIHSRQAFAECVEMIDASGVDWTRVVFHCFSEGSDKIRELNRRGGRGSFTGILTYKNADGVRAAAQAQGLGRLMLETDAPYLAPAPHRGKTNEPAFVRHTAERAAEVFGMAFDELAAVTTANARAFFGI